MAPIRRYLRITPYSVLEVRIYLDNPSLASSWLLHPRAPVLPRVIEAVRPLVLPKLKEENARERGRRGRGKGSSGGGSRKKKGVKDVVVQDDFEVSIFLTESSARHSLLTKQKHFVDGGKSALRSNSDRLKTAGEEGATSEDAIRVEEDGVVAAADTDTHTHTAALPRLRREESVEDMVGLEDVPWAGEGDEREGVGMAGSRRKRGRRHAGDDGDGLFVNDEEEDEEEEEEDDDDDAGEPLPKRVKESLTVDRQEDKKKMAMNTSYDGFSIYGRVLCLVVKKRDTGKAKSSVSAGQAMMEEWITSTQMPPGDNNDDDGS